MTQEEDRIALSTVRGDLKARLELVDREIRNKQEEIRALDLKRDWIQRQLDYVATTLDRGLLR